MWSNLSMDRRKFIKSAVAVGVVAALPAEKLWYPSKEWLLEHSSVWWVKDSRPPFPRVPQQLRDPYYGPSIVSMVKVQEAQRRTNELMRMLVDAGTITA